MTVRTIWFCTLAISLAMISVSMVPAKRAPVSAPMTTGQLTPLHSLTGVSFHSVSGF